MNTFKKGFIFGLATAIGTVAGCFYAFKKMLLIRLKPKKPWLMIKKNVHFIKCILHIKVDYLPSALKRPGQNPGLFY